MKRHSVLIPFSQKRRETYIAKALHIKAQDVAHRHPIHPGCLPPAQICDWAGFMLQARVAGDWSWWRSQGPL